MPLGLRPRAFTCTHVFAWSRADLGLGRHDRPRSVASTHVLCTDYPASVSHKSEGSGPLMHILHAGMNGI
eukprot:362639-Chlamydomonas_euryale.AAC.1